MMTRARARRQGGSNNSGSFLEYGSTDASKVCTEALRYSRRTKNETVEAERMRKIGFSTMLFSSLKASCMRFSSSEILSW